MSDFEGISLKAEVTGFARLRNEDLWPYLAAWWRVQCAQRMLDANDEETRHRISSEYHGGLAMVRAVDNFVTNNEGMLDGRITRWNKPAELTSPRRRRKPAAGPAPQA